MKKYDVKVIGAGLAGCEVALTLSSFGVKVLLADCKPKVKSPAHVSDGFCELVCSNSLKSRDVLTAHGLLKAELKELNSFVLAEADACAVPAGTALAVDRSLFSARVTEKIRADVNIMVSEELVSDFGDEPTVIASGPLTMSPLDKAIGEVFGALNFYDAEAPIVSADSIDMDNAYYASRYGKGDDTDYLNCPLTKEEYDVFYSELMTAERAIVHDFEKTEIFEGCMPVEVMGKRGYDALRFGPMKPVGLRNPKTGERPFAVVQLRKENAQGDMYNLVGFQTNLKIGEQKRVFGLIPALRSAEYLRYGVMHRNTFINAPEAIDGYFRALTRQNLFVAGQLSGVEGYVESIASGKCVALHLARILSGKQPLPLPRESIVGALSAYVATPNVTFQPMNANYGLLPTVSERDKTKRKEIYAERSISSIKKYLEVYYGT